MTKPRRDGAWSERGSPARRCCPAAIRVVFAVVALLCSGSVVAQDDDSAAARRPGRAKKVAPELPVNSGVDPIRVNHPGGLTSAPGTLTTVGPMPAAAQTGPVALIGATVHTVSGATISRGTVLFAHGVITGVGEEVVVPPEARQIDVAGMHVYPSIIAADTVLGLFEIGAVRATRDHAEVGEINPNVRAAIGVNPSSEILPVTRSNGILVAMTAPRGGLIAGTAAVLQLDGWTWEDMTLQAAAALVVEWPSMRLDLRLKAKPPLDEQRRQRDERLARLRDAFSTARAYAGGYGRTSADADAPPRDVKWDAMVAAVTRHIPVLIEADDVLEIRAAIDFAQEQGLRLILAAGRDVGSFAAELAKRQIPVIYHSTMEVGRDFEPYDVQFATPADLSRAGVLFCLSNGADPFDAAHTRDLPYIAGKAVAFGLEHEAAIAAITLNPARILGVDARLGSLESGKDATLFVCDGDPLDVRTNVHRAFIQGREVDLTDRHKRLYERYRLRPRRAADQR